MDEAAYIVLGAVLGALADHGIKALANRPRVRVTVEWGHTYIDGNHTECYRVVARNKSKMKPLDILDLIWKPKEAKGGGESIDPLEGTPLPCTILGRDTASWNVGTWRGHPQGGGATLLGGRFGVTTADGRRFFSRPFQLQSRRVIPG